MMFIIVRIGCLEESSLATESGVDHVVVNQDNHLKLGYEEPEMRKLISKDYNPMKWIGCIG